VYLPPISLQPDEIRSVITYLQSQGGEWDASVIDLPDVILETTPAEGGGGISLPQGDASAGEVLFFDLESQAGCAQCHTYDGEGGDIGPELTEEASVRSLDYIMESILLPSAVIASGYEPVQLSTTDGLIYTGVLRSEDETSITLVTKEGEEVVVLISDVDRRKEDPPSLMPDNFGDLLSTKEFLDILAFIQEGRPEQPTP
jgi:putative heme-binding domain-containing protein